MPRVRPDKISWSLFEVVLCAGIYLLGMKLLVRSELLGALEGAGRLFLQHLLVNLPLVVLPVLVVGVWHRKILLTTWFPAGSALRDMAVGLQLLLIFGLLNAFATKLVLGFDPQDPTRLLSGLQREVYETRRLREAVLLAVGIGIIVPICEEVFFRGFLYPALRRVFSAWPCIVLTSVVFALFHADSRLWPTIFLLSLVVTIVFEYSGSLIAPILVHMGANLSFVLLLVDRGDLARSMPLGLILGAFVLMNFQFFFSSKNLFVSRRSAPAAPPPPAHPTANGEPAKAGADVLKPTAAANRTEDAASARETDPTADGPPPDSPTRPDNPPRTLENSSGPT